MANEQSDDKHSAVDQLVSTVQLSLVFRRLRFAEVERYAPLLNAALREHSTTNTRRIAAFLGQVGHESGGLRYWEELWGPTPAQCGYEGRQDLGNVEPGDGYRYRGRSPIQLTGRANYARVGEALGLPLEREPDQVAEPHVGFRVAGFFWRTHGLNELADLDTFDAYRLITKRINGGLNGWDDRVRRWTAARQVFGLPQLDGVPPAAAKEA